MSPIRENYGLKYNHSDKDGFAIYHELQPETENISYLSRLPAKYRCGYRETLKRVRYVCQFFVDSYVCYKWVDGSGFR